MFADERWDGPVENHAEALRIDVPAHDGRQFGLAGFCALRRQQGRGYRVHAVARDRIWSERNHCQCYRTGIDPNSRY